MNANYSECEHCASGSQMAMTVQCAFCVHVSECACVCLCRMQTPSHTRYVQKWVLYIFIAKVFVRIILMGYVRYRVWRNRSIALWLTYVLHMFPFYISSFSMVGLGHRAKVYDPECDMHAYNTIHTVAEKTHLFCYVATQKGHTSSQW